ncbi:UxaA family hydrolase [Alicyclobacillus herbarius]|uniref:UxaA family hydrolase n=1 Tax=Alicyclobacillus herbarius TaxID=122960 RepID=UPI0004078F86|nr:UxaA family hydrolase [Alicyclobacillus herbarius]
MQSVRVFQRDDGSVAVRNHLFLLPAVVCANQVAMDVARRNPSCKYIEHQHGCAQIGKDLVQTQRVFANLAVSPNVFASLFVGLGCEGIRTGDLFEMVRSRTRRPVELVMIQGSGGTLAAQAKVEAWVRGHEAAMDSLTRSDGSWDQLTVGLLFDDPSGSSSPPAVSEFLQRMLALGVRVVVPEGGPVMSELGDAPTRIAHGEQATAKVSVMTGGSNLLETATGLTAAGAHFIVHFANQPHAFGNPLVPLIRFAVAETVYATFQDDFDGRIVDTGDVEQALVRVREIVEGRLAAAEELGLDDFALYRIGPTV